MTQIKKPFFESVDQPVDYKNITHTSNYILVHTIKIQTDIFIYIVHVVAMEQWKKQYENYTNPCSICHKIQCVCAPH